MSRRHFATQLRISERIVRQAQSRGPVPAPPPRRDPAVESTRLAREAAAGLYCDYRRGYAGYKPRHHWDQRRDFWVCRRCGFVWKPEKP